jgi:hypothetical protein
MATMEAGTATRPPAPSGSAKKAKKAWRGGKQGREKAALRQQSLPQWPKALPGVVNFATPSTFGGVGSRIVMLLFPHMLPEADFSLAKCEVLRKVIVARIERIDATEWANPRRAPTAYPWEIGPSGPPRVVWETSLLTWVLRALLAEEAARRTNSPETNRWRYPGGHTTALTRYLGAYLKEVESAEALVPARADLYEDFARVIGDGRAALTRKREVTTDDDSDGDGGPLAGDLDSELRAHVRYFEKHGNYHPLFHMLGPREQARYEELRREETSDEASDEDPDDEQSIPHPSAAGPSSPAAAADVAMRPEGATQATDTHMRVTFA